MHCCEEGCTRRLSGRRGLAAAVSGEAVKALAESWRATAEGFSVDLHEVQLMIRTLKGGLNVTDDALTEHGRRLFVLFDLEAVRACAGFPLRMLRAAGRAVRLL